MRYDLGIKIWRKKTMNTDKIYAESIANEYSPKDTSKVIALKKLDRKAKLPSDIFGYTFGIVSALLLGVGMCLCMEVFSVSSVTAYVLGIVIGVIGIAGCSINYPIFKKIREKGMKKYANDIIMLANDISEKQ